MNKSYKTIFVFFVFFFSVVLLTSIPSVSSNDTLKINTFLVYEDSASVTSKTVTQGDSFNVVMVAYGHGEALQYEKLELVSSTSIFQESVSGSKIDTYTWMYTRTYTVNSGILVPGTYTLRFTARTINGNEEYSDLQLIILPKVVPPICGDGKKEGTEQCDSGTNNGKPCNPLYGSSCTYCSDLCKLITLTGPYCGDGTCNNGETCNSCSTDCGECPDTIKPVVDITYPTATTYTSHRTSLTFNVYDDNLQSCTYKLNGNAAVNIPSVINGVRTITGITSVVGSNTWSVACRDASGNIGTDSVTFTVTLPVVCGDGKKEGTEQCDSGTNNGKPCNPLYGSSCTYCSDLCKLITLTGPYCGDGIKQSNEQCDDNNNVNGDGCSSTCTLEETKECVLQLTKLVNDTNVKPGEMVSFTLKYKNIGDGACTGGGVKVQDVLSSKFKVIAYSANVKDDSDGQGVSFGYSGIPAYDSSTNTLTFNAHTVSPGEEGIIMISAKVLEPSQCGDFQINNQFKVWSNEKGWQNSNTVIVYVDNDCYTPVCGNNLKEGTEQCDSGTNNGKPCNPLYGSSCTYCSDLCKLITLTGPYCGDGIKQSNEQCDDNNNVNGDGCSSTCTLEETKECVLQLTKLVNDTNVKPGEMVSFTLKYKNIGDGACTGGGVKVQDVLSSKFKVIAYSANVKDDSDGQGVSFGYSGIPAYDSSTNTLTFNAHTVSPGEEGIIMISAKVLEPSQCGDFQINNQFKVWSNEKGWQNSNTVIVYVDNDCYTPVCGNNLKEGTEQCDSGTNNGKPCNPLYGSSCTYCSDLCKLITLTGPYCGDGTCSDGENCSSCPTDCGNCSDTQKPFVNITYPIEKDYCPHRTSLIFNVYDDNLQSCTYILNGANPVNVSSLNNGLNTITGITSVVGSNTWSVTCRDASGNSATDSVTFTVTCLPVCGDGICNGKETCLNCPTDCGKCPEKNCTTCKDSKPLDDRDYIPTTKTTIVYEDSDDLPGTDENALNKNKSPLIALSFIMGVLILLILIIVIRLSRR